jgi:hypothetical protein
MILTACSWVKHIVHEDAQFMELLRRDGGIMAKTGVGQ